MPPAATAAATGWKRFWISQCRGCFIRSRGIVVVACTVIGRKHFCNSCQVIIDWFLGRDLLPVTVHQNTRMTVGEMIKLNNSETVEAIFHSIVYFLCSDLHRLMSWRMEFKVFNCFPSRICLVSFDASSRSYMRSCNGVGRQHTNCTSLGGKCFAFKILPLFRMNSFTMVDSSFWRMPAAFTSALDASGSRAANIGRSYLFVYTNSRRQNWNYLTIKKWMVAANTYLFLKASRLPSMLGLQKLTIL